VLQSAARYVSGDWDGSAAAAETPDPPVSDTVRARLAAVGLYTAVGRGRFAETDRLLAELRPYWAREAEIALAGGNVGAELALWQGNPELAASRAVEALDFAAQRGSGWPLAGIRLLAWALAGQADVVRKARRDKDTAAVDAGLTAADALLARAVETGQRGRPWNGVLGPEGKAWLAVAAAERSRSDGPGDPDRWRAAVTAFEYGDVYSRALTRWRLAEALLGADDRDGAAEQLQLAGEAAQRLQAGPLSNAVSGLARRGRITVPGLVAVRAEADPFTPRERAVLTLVAAGCTNREVGDQLFISEKTVSVHLSRIMAKLGAGRRAEAVATAYDRGLLEPPAP
jgi:DNA-binding CsgD family transcriptional regulator